MKREIKFRGLQKVGKFAYGKLLSDGAIGRWGNSNTYNYADVNPETVGQFTGFKDIKGVEIYEGDILKRANNKLVEVYWRDEYGCFDGAYINFEGSNILSTYVSDSEVIGNIYQNTELLP